ncbi:MAG: hypothetical protein OMM_01812 [Candidatus Magnetoglobus multicellularis str. Araruama]|uniref:Uncharacterized protein n=1 Tax=Candidatus Magnetoglobus multicellularis str. Araruama TaxID=890399 RepID=A0A1V1PBU7_9BACT|nr:MAG: hypothetical protein OMM_01812 [Candidatus Magnetoglobus multicellularis str. Araruama]
MSLVNIIKSVVSKLQKDFSNHPYDFTSYEIEAQVRVYNELMKKIEGTFRVNRPDAVPPFKSEKTPCVKLEWKLGDNRHDIVVFKKDVTDPESYDDIEGFIEIKSGWGETQDHLLNKSVIKDFVLVQTHANIGYLIIFLANNFYDISKKYQDFYRKTLDAHKKTYGIKEGHVYLVFRDEILS